ncbi:hypothetical protein [Alteromonas sp.]|uniref:hypothetical protein n=1 Tax=Alteromonas sp. TaxID=232 RepID=UPI002580EBD2|nr:hypothetical protein [Alteromonas sp.]NQY18698.1 hypothetical protein [Alteromonas sp.]
MSDLLHIVKGLSAQPKCVLVLGARTEAMLNWLLSLTASQVLLVEPEPAMFEKANALHIAKGKPDNVAIMHGVPIFESEQKTVSYFASNVPGFSSILPPNVIKSIRPALEFTEQEAPVIELKPLLQQFDISESRPCLLITQLNGGELQCVNKQIVNAFTHVVIQSASKPIFGESKPVEKLKKELAECGRDYLELAESMPPYSNFVATKKVNAEQALNYFNQRQQHREIKAELESQLSASQNDAKKLAEELQQAKQQLQSAKQEAEGKQKQLGEELQQAKQQLQSAKQEAEGKQKQLGDELLQVKEQLQNAKQQSEEKQKQLEDELTQSKEQLQIVQKHAEDSLKQLQEEMQHTIQKLSEERAQEHHWHNEHKKWAESLNREKEELANRLSESQSEKEVLAAEIEKIRQRETKLTSSVEVNAKLILKMQLDSDDLRTKYVQKTQSEKELRQLIGELHSKLQQAANFYHQLENKHPEILLGSDNID